jgi:hypothetical protein
VLEKRSSVAGRRTVVFRTGPTSCDGRLRTSVHGEVDGGLLELLLVLLWWFELPQFPELPEQADAVVDVGVSSSGAVAEFEQPVIQSARNDPRGRSLRMTCLLPRAGTTSDERVGAAP